MHRRKACFQPLSASATMKGSVALLSAYVEVRGTPPGMLATQCHHLVHHHRRVRRGGMRGFPVQPPWSMATSTITLPGFIASTMSRVMSLVPRHRDQHADDQVGRKHLALDVVAIENTVVTLPLNIWIDAAECIEAAVHHHHPNSVPTAICAAFVPTTPAPRDDDLGRRDAGHATGAARPCRHAPAQAVRTRLDRHAARDPDIGASAGHHRAGSRFRRQCTRRCS